MPHCLTAAMSQPVLRLPVFAAVVLTLTASLFGQEPEPTPAPETPAPEAPAPEAPAAEQEGNRPTGSGEEGAAPGARGRRFGGFGRGMRGRSQRVTAIRAGHVHPVSGPTIENGVVLVSGRRITAVGSQDEVEIPEGATVRDLPDAHVYPGLVDALTDAFLGDSMRGSSAVDAGTEVKDALTKEPERENELLQNGITTAFVGMQSNAVWRGIGTVIRPGLATFEPFAEHERAGVQVRVTNGPAPSHALERRAFVESTMGAFKALEAYEEGFKKHEEALEKYAKDFDAWIAWHEKKNGKQPKADAGAEADAEAEAKPADAQEEAAPQQPRRSRRPGGGRGRPERPGERPGGGEQPPLAVQDPKPETPPQQDPKSEARKQDPQPGQEQATSEKKAQEKAPERPNYPQEPKRDPAKDALLELLDGSMPLRAEAHRPDEILALLRTAEEHEVVRVVLEEPVGAASVAETLAEKGVPCVLTGLWPQPAIAAYEDFDVAALPTTLEAHGVAFALATGSGRRAGALPMLAAIAAGKGLDEAAAIRAITLTPAEILGVQKDVGSLQRGKLADLLICDRPLLQSDCRILEVMTAGTTAYQAENK